MKKYFNYFIYISIIFLIITLIRYKYLGLPKVVYIQYFILSLVLLICGFILQGVTWKIILGEFNFKISYNDSIKSFGLSIFGKYIPGKLWMLLGKAGYIVKYYDYPTDSILTISFNAQFISLWVGLFLGAFGLIFLKITFLFGLFVLLSWIFLTLVVFSNKAHIFVQGLLKKILKKKINIPCFSFSTVFRILPFFTFYWLLYSIGFFFLYASMTNNLNLLILFVFPLAGTLGTIMVIAPGGLGIREGIIVSYLAAIGLNLFEATTISVFSRVWFLIGEFSIFIIALLLKRKVRKNE